MLPTDLLSGDEQLDSHHVRIIQEVYEIGKTGRDPNLDLLRTHFAEHFGWEEMLMEQHNYPDLESHRRAHLYFFDVFIHRRAVWLGQKTEEARQELILSLTNWVEQHVLDEDARLATWMRYHR